MKPHGKKTCAEMEDKKMKNTEKKAFNLNDKLELNLDDLETAWGGNVIRGYIPPNMNPVNLPPKSILGSIKMENPDNSILGSIKMENPVNLPPKAILGSILDSIDGNIPDHGIFKNRLGNVI